MALFKSARQRELEAETQFRRGKGRIRRFIHNAKRVRKRYWDLGKEALRLGDEVQFAQLAGACARARDHVNRWERYLLQLETLGVRREEVAATGEFLKSISAMTASMLRGATPEQVAKMQLQMEEALSRSESLENMLSIAMEASSNSIFGSEEFDHEELTDISQVMRSEAETDEGTRYDARITDGLERIRDDMRKEMQ